MYVVCEKKTSWWLTFVTHTLAEQTQMLEKIDTRPTWPPKPKHIFCNDKESMAKFTSVCNPFILVRYVTMGTQQEQKFILIKILSIRWGVNS